jgi:PKD repeat protein
VLGPRVGSAHVPHHRPTADFTYTVDGTNPKKLTFTNGSNMSIACEWNFGDGSAVSAEGSPIHTFAAPGTYTVTLKALGITGEQDKTIKTTDISIL